MEETKYKRTPACLQFDAELMAFLEGEEKPLVASHAQECVFCRVVLADLQQILSLARELPLLKPSAAVWANIRAVLDQEGVLREKVTGWSRLQHFLFLQNPAAIGALACLVLFASFLTVRPESFGPQVPSDLVATMEKPAAAYPVNSSEDRNLTQMIQDLEKNFRANEKLLTPETQATYEKGLVSLDISIRECRDSLRQEPANTLARDYLMAAYTRKAEVLASALEFGGR